MLINELAILDGDQLNELDKHSLMRQAMRAKAIKTELKFKRLEKKIRMRKEDEREVRSDLEKALKYFRKNQWKKVAWELNHANEILGQY
jgi:hypothetical protein